MTSTRVIAILGLVATTLCAPARGQSLLSFGGETPLVCRVRLAAGPAGSLGRLTEFCNAANGYEVWADYPASLADSALLLDGKPILLSKSGATRIDRSNRPGIAVKDVTIVPTRASPRYLRPRYFAKSMNSWK